MGTKSSGSQKYELWKYTKSKFVLCSTLCQQFSFRIWHSFIKVSSNTARELQWSLFSHFAWNLPNQMTKHLPLWSWSLSASKTVILIVQEARRASSFNWSFFDAPSWTSSPWHLTSSRNLFLSAEPFRTSELIRSRQCSGLCWFFFMFKLIEVTWLRKSKIFWASSLNSSKSSLILAAL